MKPWSELMTQRIALSNYINGNQIPSLRGKKSEKGMIKGLDQKPLEGLSPQSKGRGAGNGQRLSRWRPEDGSHLSACYETSSWLPSALNERGGKKLNHIEGNSLPRDDPKFEAWDDEDSLIMRWLWNAITPKIS
ncbi:hypothetical protein CR513_01216, partial [Mucuna pruriens]